MHAITGQKIWFEEIKDGDGKRWAVRLICHQPAPELLHALDKYGGIVSRFDVAFDFFPREMATEQLAEFIRRSTILQWRRAGRMHQHKTTTYWNEEHKDIARPDRNLALYADRPSKLRNDANPIVHLELRLQSAKAIKKENLTRPSDLIGIDPRQLFDKHISFKDFQRHIQRDILDSPHKNRVRGFYHRFYQNALQPFKDRRPDIVDKMPALNGHFILGDQLTWGARSGSKDHLTWKPIEPSIECTDEIQPEAPIIPSLS